MDNQGVRGGGKENVKSQKPNDMLANDFEKWFSRSATPAKGRPTELAPPGMSGMKSEVDVCNTLSKHPSTTSIQEGLVDRDADMAVHFNGNSQIKHYDDVPKQLASMQLIEHSTPATRYMDRLMSNPEELSLNLLKFLILKDVQEAAQKKAKVEDELVEMQIEVVESGGKMVNLEKDKQSLSKAFEHAGKEIGTLQGKLKHCEEYAMFLEQKSEEDEIRNENHIFELREELKAKDEELNLKEHDLEDCRDDLEDRSEELELCHENLEESHTDVQNLQSKVESLEKVTAELLNSKAESLKKLTTELSDSQAKTSVLEQLVKKMIGEKESIEKENRELYIKFGVLRAASKRKIQELEESAQKEITKLKFKIGLLKATNNDTTEELQQSQNEFSDWKLQTFFNPMGDCGLGSSGHDSPSALGSLSLEMMPVVAGAESGNGGVVCVDSLI